MKLRIGPRRCRCGWWRAGGSTGRAAPRRRGRLDELAERLAGRASSPRAGGQQLDDLRRVQHAAPASGDRSVARSRRAGAAARSAESATSTTTPSPAGAKRAGTRSARASVGSRRRPWTSSISMPRPVVAGAIGLRIEWISSRLRSITGQTCRSTRFHCSRRLGLRCAWKRRIPASAPTSMRSSSGRATARPSALRTGVRSRTSARAKSRSSFGLARSTPWKR